jgi:glutamate racemase
MEMTMRDERVVVGVFDSGVGGLTVLRALRAQLPMVDFIYLGDTARLPYGTKTAASVTMYALQATRALLARQVDFIVVACNTAASAALPTLQKEFPNIPIVGVIEPGAKAACATSKNGRIGVIATEGTVQGGAYTRSIQACWPGAEIISHPCQLLVALAEEGWNEGPLVQQIVDELLRPLTDNKDHEIDCLVLGCTHFPPFAGVIQNAIGAEIKIVDSASTTALLVAQQLTEKGLLAEHNNTIVGREVFLATDGKERFARVGSRFWHRPIELKEVELVDL